MESSKDSKSKYDKRPKGCGVCFEIIDVYCKEAEPKWVWAPTPLEEMEDNTHYNVDNTHFFHTLWL